MGNGFHFFLALMVATTTLVGGSIAWPRLTTEPRPQLLSQVHDAAMQTPLGQRTAMVLGVTDEAAVIPINPGEVAGSWMSQARQSAQNRVSAVIVGNAVNQLKSRFDKMSPQQKEQVREVFCIPPEDE